MEERLEFYKKEYEKIGNDLQNEETFDNHERYCALLQAHMSLLNLINQLESFVKRQQEEIETKRKNEEAREEE